MVGTDRGHTEVKTSSAGEAMNFSNPIQDHNDRVAHSDEWNEPPDNNEPEFFRGDFYIPEKVEIRCWQCGQIIEHCDICGEPFDSEDRNEVACGQFPDRSGSNGHICMSCWDELPEGKQ